MMETPSFPEKILSFVKRRHDLIIDAAVLAGCLVFIASYLPPTMLLWNTTPTGGDTPAHNYMVSRLQESLRHGSIISYAGGWWSGFPMFQYYFFLPYLIMAVLGYVIPVNVAFKLVSAAGIYLLPVFVYFGFRQTKSPRSAPIVLAVLSLPFVFVQTHTMWGVNIKSTLAGMISNSISFCLFVLFLGYALRDLEEKKFRPATAILLALCFYSHFFTTLIACLVIGASVFLWGRGWWGRAKVLMPTAAIGVLCAAFWLFPLMLKGAYSVEFGGDWDEKLLKTMPQWAFYVAPLLAPALSLGIWKKNKTVGLYVIMFFISLFFWYVGGRINSGFGNIRFWPFIFFAFVVVCGLGLSFLLDLLKYDRFAVIAVAGISLALLSYQKDEVSGWFKWNMDGVEKKGSYPILKEIMKELKGTPGRFINDQSGVNNRFGSDRIFEAMPAMIGKPLLVGGIVNSATGSLFTYTVQCEISKGCAGFPKLVSAPQFNVDAALRHMDLYSVSHMVGYYDRFKKEMENRPGWTMVRKVKDYEIYARDGGPTPYVVVPPNRPAYMETDNWKERAIEWFGVPGLLDRPFAFINPGRKIADEELSLKFDLAAYFGVIAQSRPDPTDIPCWSLLGPYYHKPEMTGKEAYTWNPTGRDEAGLRPGTNVGGMKWRPFVQQGSSDVDTMMNPSHHLVAYFYSGIYSGREQAAQLLLDYDDDISVFWNGHRLKDAPRADPRNPLRVRLDLREGRSDLILKLNQGVGGAYFRARLQTMDGDPVSDVRYGPDSLGPAPAVSPAFVPARTDCAVAVDKFEDEIVKFRTNCLGEPHIIKYSYFPNWKVRGARAIYQVSPNFMLVYPRENEVTLTYGAVPVDTISRLLTALGYALLAGAFFLTRRNRKKAAAVEGSEGKIKD